MTEAWPVGRSSTVAAGASWWLSSLPIPDACYLLSTTTVSLFLRPLVLCPSSPTLMSDVPKLSITLLGAGQEVGRSCCVLQYRGRTIVCDAGVHPAYSGIASLPFVDDLDWSTVDVLLVTQYVILSFSS